MTFRIDEFSNMPQAADLTATERMRFNTVGFGFAAASGSLQHPALLFGGQSLGRTYIAGFLDDDGVAIASSFRTGALDQGAPRREKKYSDLAIQQEGDGETITVSTFESDDTAVTKVLFATTTIRGRILLDAFLDRRVRNVSIEVSWNEGEPKIYFGAIRYLFDEAVETIRWSSEEIDHGSPSWVTPIYAQISIRSEGVVQLAVIAHRQDGTKQTSTYLLPSTDDVKRKIFVPFNAVKGALFEYRFLAMEVGVPFQLYRDETTFFVRPWGQATLVPTKPVGDAVAVSSSEVANVRGVR